jgi:hypothetical protein
MLALRRASPTATVLGERLIGPRGEIRCCSAERGTEAGLFLSSMPLVASTAFSRYRVILIL